MKWISGQDLLSKWHIQKADFFEIVLLDRELQPYDWKGAPVNVDIYSDSLDISRKLKKFFEEQPLMEGLRTQEAKHAALCAQIGNDLLDCRYLHTEVRDFESRYPPLTGASEPSADAAGPKTERSGRETTRPTGTAKEKFRDYAKGVIDRAQAENTKLPTRADLAEQTLNAFPDTINPKTGKPYESQTVIDWIRDLFPDHSPLKLGAKTKK